MDFELPELQIVIRWQMIYYYNKKEAILSSVLFVLHYFG